MNRLKQPSAWTGVWTALITPLRKDLELDEASLASLIDDQIKQDVTGLVIAGSTGEGSLLRPAVYEKLLHRARELAADRIPLVAGLGIGGTESCLKNLELARKAGFEGVLASPPAYVKSPQRGLVQHFLAIAEQGLAVCLYEIPGRAASSMENATIVEIVEKSRGNVTALKDATADLTRPLALRAKLGSKIALLTGDDPTYAAYLASGGDGVVSVASHLALKQMKQIQAWVRTGQNAKAAAEQARLLPFINDLFRESNPIPVKSLLAAQGRISEVVFCPPLVPMKAEWLAELQKLAGEV